MPTTPPASALRHPFTEILGTRANVAVLRELCMHGREMRTTDLALRTRLTRPGIRLALASLTHAGVVEMVGGGRAILYRVDRGHPLTVALERLFEAEAARTEAVIAAIRASTADDWVKAVWIYGSFARGKDRFDSDLDICAVLEENESVSVADDIRARLRQVDADLAVTTSLVTIGPEDLRRLAKGDPWWDAIVREAIVIRGPRPQDWASSGRKAARP